MKLKNKITLVLFLYLFSINLFAKELKIKEPKDSRVIVTGKIEVIYDEDRSFIAKTFGIAEKDYDKSDVYERPEPFEENRCVDNKNIPAVINNGEYFFDICWKAQNKVRYKDTLYFHFLSGLGDVSLEPGFFYTSSDRLKFSKKIPQNIYIRLPFIFDIELPKDSKAVYIGTIRYYVTGDNFEIQKIEVLDEYDSAKIEFGKNTEKKIELYNVVPSGSKTN